MILGLPLILGLAHGVSDASAGLLVGWIIQQQSPGMNSLILLYNLLAFGLQLVAGLLFDRLHQPKLGACSGLLLTMIGVLIIQSNLILAILLIGIGSACLHAGGGSIAITTTPGKASAPGVFAAFGVIGLSLGGMGSLNFSSGLVGLLAVLLAGMAVIIGLFPQYSPKSSAMARSSLPIPEIVIVLLVLAITLRSTVWVGAQMTIGRYSSAALWVALAAGLGKLVGGFAADHLGWKRWLLVSMPGAVVLLGLTGQRLPGMIIGAFLLQSMTPLSIAAVGRALPKSPALAASFALGTAIIAGGLPFFIFSPGWFNTGILVITLLVSGLFYWIFLASSHLVVME